MSPGSCLPGPGEGGRSCTLVLGDKVVEGQLLRCEVRARREGGPALEGEVEALMAAVEVGTAGEDEFRADAETDPPDVKAGEAADGLGGEGGAVIGADGFGQAELAEDTLKDGLGEVGGWEALAGEAEAREAVEDGEGEAVAAVEGLELALEVGGPDGIGARG